MFRDSRRNKKIFKGLKTTGQSEGISPYRPLLIKRQPGPSNHLRAVFHFIFHRLCSLTCPLPLQTEGSFK